MITEFKRSQRDYPLSFKIAGVNRSKKARSPVNRPGSDRVACQFLGYSRQARYQGCARGSKRQKQNAQMKKKDNLFNDRW